MFQVGSSKTTRSPLRRCLALRSRRSHRAVGAVDAAAGDPNSSCELVFHLEVETSKMQGEKTLGTWNVSNVKKNIPGA